MKVGIIGAGVAGLTAAKYLLKNHPECEVTILEAEDRIGGRVNTIKVDGDIMELGANWLCFDYFIQKACERGLELIPSDIGFDVFSKNTYYYNGSLLRSDDFDIVFNFVKRFAKLCLILPFKIRFSVFLKFVNFFVFKKDYKIILQLMNRSFSDICQTDLDRLQLIPEFFEVGGDDFILKDGIISLLDDHVENIDIRLSHKVEVIDYQSDQVFLKTKKNGNFNFDKVLVTVSLGVLKSNKIKFTPTLPVEKLSAIKNIGFARCEKFFYFYEEQFYDRPDMIGVFNSGDNNKLDCLASTYFYNFSKIFSKPVLLEFVFDRVYDQVKNMTDEELIERNYKMLQSVYGDKAQKAKKIVKSNWVANENFCGSYSAPTMSIEKDDRANLQKNIDNKVYFAGEATELTSFIDNAAQSAIKACKEMLV